MIVGVTGGIGSGKSTVCRLFAAQGRVVLSADEIADELTATDPGIRSQLVKKFGSSVFFSDGSLDRKRLAGIVFRNKALLKNLNSIIHPPVIARIKRVIHQLPPARRRPFVVVEAALIFEARLEGFFDYVVVIDAPLEDRVRRVTLQAGLSKAEVLRRARFQMSAAAIAKKADFVVRNHQGEAELRDRILFLNRLLSTSTGV